MDYDHFTDFKHLSSKINVLTSLSIFINCQIFEMSISSVNPNVVNFKGFDFRIDLLIVTQVVDVEVVDWYFVNFFCVIYFITCWFTYEFYLYLTYLIIACMRNERRLACYYHYSHTWSLKGQGNCISKMICMKRCCVTDVDSWKRVLIMLLMQGRSYDYNVIMCLVKIWLYMKSIILCFCHPYINVDNALGVFGMMSRSGDAMCIIMPWECSIWDEVTNIILAYVHVYINTYTHTFLLIN